MLPLLKRLCSSWGRKDILAIIDLLNFFSFGTVFKLFIFIYFNFYLICNQPFQYDDEYTNLYQ